MLYQHSICYLAYPYYSYVAPKSTAVPINKLV